MIIKNNPFTFDRQAMAALRLTFPDAKVIDQGFNSEFVVEFDNGKYGYCGVADGPLECNMFWSQLHMAETGQPYESITVASVYEQKITGYEGKWIKNEEGQLDLDCGAMYIDKNKLYVGIDRGEYLVGTGEEDHLKYMANKYMLMLDAVTSTGMLDGPDVLLLPETMKIKLTTGEEDRWGEERCFFKTMRDL